MNCDKCGAELPKGWANPSWAECVVCHPPKVAFDVGPQPHLMSDGERWMHLRHKKDCEEGRRNGTLDFKAKGPLEFRPD